MTRKPDEAEDAAVFGYGSLVSSASIAEVLGRPADRAVRARLQGWRRRWSLQRHNLESEKTFALRDGRLPTWVLSLNVEPAPRAGPAPNGLVIPVTHEELGRLDAREHRYHRIDVTAAIVTSEPTAGVARVFTYTARAGHHAASAPADAVVLRSYFETVERAFAELGDDELARYRATTGPPPVDVVEGRLVADAIPEGNPRDW